MSRRPVHTAAALADGTGMNDLHGLSRAQLQAMADSFYRMHLLCEMAAGQAPYPRVARTYAEAIPNGKSEPGPETAHNATGDFPYGKCAPAPRNGVLAALKAGERQP